MGEIDGKFPYTHSYAAMLTFGSLFSGIGGFDLGFERAGMKCLWQVEIDDYCRRVLSKHWPSVQKYGDITKVDWSSVEKVDVIAGGFPCQPHSVAGKRKASADERDLWGECVRCLSDLRPSYALFENVAGLLTSERGRFFNRVISDLAACGYDAEWQIVSAAEVGAPHIRERVFVVAWNVADTESGRRGFWNASYIWQEHMEGHSPSNGGSLLAHADSERQQEQCGPVAVQQKQSGAECSSGDVSDTSSIGEAQRRHAGFSETSIFGERWGNNRSGTPLDVSREWWSTEPAVGRVAHGVPNRVDRLRALGNAIVPQVAEYIGQIVVWHNTALQATRLRGA